MASPALLRVADLSVDLDPGGGGAPAVDRVSFAVGAGETLALVGESGAGKSLTALAVMGLIRTPPARVTGRIDWRGRDLLLMDERALRRVRGAQIAMVFQDPASALNPVRSIGAQIGEAIRLHEGLGRRETRRRTVALLERVGIAAAARRAGAYPHELSAGMRQRAMIAMAIAGAPDLLIADEPTSALDVTVQAQVLALLADLRRATAATLLITHDLGVVAAIADRMTVMYAGRLVEAGSTRTVFRAPGHPYTRALLAARPRLDAPIDQRPPPIPGHPPPSLGRPAGCAFHPRCPLAEDRCRTAAPELRSLATGHEVACHVAVPGR